jgi:hypothetical protein
MTEKQRKAWLAKWEQLRKDRPFTQAQYDDLCKDYYQTNETEPPGLGSSKLWLLSYTHNFFLAGLIHDIQYPDRDGFVFHNTPRLAVDKAFKRRCMNLSRNWLEDIEACAFYRLVRLYQPRDWVVI